MACEVIALRVTAQLFAQRATNVDPVVGGDFHKVDINVAMLLQRAQQGPPQPESGAMEWPVTH
ncbi:MAG: hypothetical protein DHS20C11_02800 [Lysobacteraceae bacterium]|nr:MAG: hypothetical protein DHS20C11_02800 [Xanthomonadaceae bacterium]